MMIGMEVMKVQQTAAYSVNAERAGRHEPCFRCGRGIKRESYLVHLKTDGTVVAVEQAILEAEDQGWFPIGPECAKTLPSTHRWLRQ